VLIHFQNPSSFLSQKLQQVPQTLQNGGSLSVLKSPTQRHLGPAKPRSRVAKVDWPTIARRILENEEPLRKVADDYHVSYETIRRIVQASRHKQHQ
jgi:hypothetical protein